MIIGIGVWAFVIYITVIVMWMMLLKRNIAEAMGVGLIIVALFNGPAAIAETIFLQYGSGVCQHVLAFHLYPI